MSSLTRLVTGVKRLGITLNGEQIAQFSRYEELLLDWNQRMNLTAIREADLIQERHFLDSLTCVLATGNLNGLSLEATQQAAQDYIDTDKVIWVVVGDRQKIEPALRELGFEEIRFIDADGQPVTDDQ